MSEGTTYRPEPGKVVVVGSIPDCNFCQDGTPGPYDFKTTLGPWANGCEAHWKEHRASGSLGVGQGQLWITKDQVAGTTEMSRRWESDKDFLLNLGTEIDGTS